MQRYFWTLLFVLVSFPSFSSAPVDELGEVYKNFKTHLSQTIIQDEEFITYMDTVKKDHNAVFKKFLNTESLELSETENKEYPTHIVFARNRPKLFDYFLRNNAKLSLRFKKPIDELSGYFKGMCLSPAFTPLLWIAMKKLSVSDNEINEFFSHLYMNFIPPHIVKYEENIRLLNDCKKKLVEREKTIVNLKSRTKDALDRSDFQYKTLQAAHHQTITDKTALEDQHVKLQAQEQALKVQYDLLEKKNAELHVQFGELEVEYQQKIEALGLSKEKNKQRKEALRLSKDKSKQRKESLRQLNADKDALSEQHCEVLERKNNLQEQYNLLMENYDQLYRHHTELGQNYLTQTETLQKTSEEKQSFQERYEIQQNVSQGLMSKRDHLLKRHSHPRDEYAQLEVLSVNREEVLREKDLALLESEQRLRDKLVALERLIQEKNQLAERHEQADINSQIQIITQEKLFPGTRERSILVSHNHSALSLMENSSSSQEDQAALFQEMILPFSLEKAKDSVRLTIPDFLYEEAAIEQAQEEVERKLSAHYSQKNIQLMREQDEKIHAVEAANLEKSKEKETEANLASEKNKRAEIARYFLELELEQKRNRG